MESNKLKVLVVEDLPLAQKMATLILEQLDCHVTLAETGVEAIQLAKDHAFHLIFMDLGLPDIDGITVAETIKKIDAVKCAIPIIALTANSDEQIRQACVQAGLADFIAKPITLASAAAVLEKYRGMLKGSC